MKRYFFILLCVLPFSNLRAQDQEALDSLKSASNDMLYNLYEYTVGHEVDSLIEGGLYNQALERLDSLDWKRKDLLSDYPSVISYMRRILVYSKLNDYWKLDEVADDCIYYRKNEMNDESLSSTYYQLALSNMNIHNYSKAIKAYENAIIYYKKMGKIDGAAVSYSSLGDCYNEKGRGDLAVLYNEKALEYFLDYFGTTRSELLQKDLSVSNSLNQNALNICAITLFKLHLSEKKKGHSKAAREYMRMAKHCGVDKILKNAR